MDEHQKEDKHNQQKICTCKPLIDNSDTFRNNDLQWNVNPTRDNDSNLHMHVDESTSQNTNSNVPLEEDITEDSKVIKEEKQETNNKSENFNMQCGSKMAAHNNEMMAGNVSNNEEINEIQDLSKPTAKKEEVYEVPQKKIESVSDNVLKLNKSFKQSEINNETVKVEMDNNIMQTLEVKSKKNSNENKLVEHASDIMGTELLSGQDVKLFRQENTGAVKSTKDQFTQTDSIKNDQFSHKATQTNLYNYAINNEQFMGHLHSVVNRTVLQYNTIIQNVIQELYTPFQIVFPREETVPADNMMGSQAVRNAAPERMQEGLPYEDRPSPGLNIGSRAIIHHPYASQHIRIRNDIRRTVQQSNIRYNYRQNSVTQNQERETENDNQNPHDQQRQ